MSSPTTGIQPTTYFREVLTEENTYLNLNLAIETLRKRTLDLLFELSLEEKWLHHYQIDALEEKYKDLSKNHELSAGETTVGFIGIVLNVIGAGFTKDCSTERALSAVGRLFNKANELLNHLQEGKNAGFNGQITLMQKFIEDTNKTFDSTIANKGQVERTLDEILSHYRRLLKECS